MNINEAREEYEKGNISFLELDKIFFEQATQEQIKEFYQAPVYDRPSVIKGKNRSDRDAEWNSFVES